eukprot:TRINITY_DN24507_c0_g1_i2.p1 TRINITY_DN24507_c0_g1~~TRINITY_DN24507_c0_g1_i2.p1  ORF type:complete len:121 (+),score=28.83 TRINITY_DN24507_c0_g1_i2:98-460(+)
MIRRPPRSTLSSSSAASDVYKRQLYAIGGYSGGCIAGVEVFDTEAQQWSTVAPMPMPRDEHCSAVSGDRIYVFGGWRKHPDGTMQNQLVDVEYYEVSTDTWRSPPQPMNCARRQAAAVAI